MPDCMQLQAAVRSCRDFTALGTAVMFGTSPRAEDLIEIYPVHVYDSERIILDSYPRISASQYGRSPQGRTSRVYQP